MESVTLKTRQDLVREWDWGNNIPLTPFNISPQALIRWRCRYKHSWQASVSDRLSGKGCPKCSSVFRRSGMNRGKNLKVGVNDLSTLRPDLAAEWDYSKNAGITPQAVTCGSIARVWWICKDCGHKWDSSIISRCKTSGCPNCRLNKPIKENKCS